MCRRKAQGMVPWRGRVEMWKVRGNERRTTVRGVQGRGTIRGTSSDAGCVDSGEGISMKVDVESHNL